MKRRMGDGRYDIEKRYPEYPPEYDQQFLEEVEDGESRMPKMRVLRKGCPRDERRPTDRSS